MSRIGNICVLEVDKNVNAREMVHGDVLKNGIGTILSDSPQPSGTVVVHMKPRKKYYVCWTPCENIFQNFKNLDFEPTSTEIRAHIEDFYYIDGADFNDGVSCSKKDMQTQRQCKYILFKMELDSVHPKLHNFELSLKQDLYASRLEETYTFNFLSPEEADLQTLMIPETYEASITLSTLRDNTQKEWPDQIVNLTGRHGILTLDAHLDRKFRIHGVVKNCKLKDVMRNGTRVYKMTLLSQKLSHDSHCEIILELGQIGSKSKKNDISELETACRKYHVMTNDWNTANKFFLFL
jgi:hypothetical protein